MMSRFSAYVYLWWAMILILIPSWANAACSDFVGDVVINEVYDGQGTGAAFVETKLLSNSLALWLSGGWSIRICHQQGNRDECRDYNLDGGEWIEYVFGNPYFMFYPSNQSMDIKGMDITVRDYLDNVIDYLSVNGYVHQNNACSAVADNNVDLGPGIKGAQRLPDGTGNWSPFKKSGAADETSPNGSNQGALAQIDHYRIYHPTDALTCQAASVSVQACTDASCSNNSDVETTVTLSSSGTWGGGTNSTTFTGVSPPLYLRKNTEGNATIGIASATVAATQPLRCYANGMASDCSIAFHDSGFIFDVSNLTACQDSTAVNIQAVRKDDATQACVGDRSFANQKNRPVNLSTAYLDPGSPVTRLLVNGTMLPLVGSAAVPLDFDGQARSTLVVNYADAGKLRLDAAYVGTGDETGLKMLGSSPEFVVSPHHLRVRATTDGTILLNNATSNGNPHWPAGEDFKVEIAGVCSGGSVTPSFAALTDLEATAANPAAGEFTGGPFAAGAYNAGVVSGPAAYSEVGTVTLQAQVANYLGSGIDVTGSATIGRFTPHHFVASPNSPLFATACSVGGFTYVGQAFDYAMAPVITVTAKNSQGDTTANYTGEWWKITNATLSGKTYSAAQGTLDLTGIPATDPVISDLGGGMGLLTFDSGSGMRFVRGAPVAPFDADISLSINVLDADGIAATDNPVTFGAATAGNGIAFDHGKTMRWGRISLKNAYGSELLALPMPMRTEYFDGTAFRQNWQDGCTPFALTQLLLNDAPGDQPVAVGSGSSSATLRSPMLAGDAGLSFSAPGSNGYIQVRTDLSLLPWLRYDWDGDGSHDNAPTARASFGLYKGRPGMIYMRESFR